jgi:hypothetical protein
MRDSTFYYQTLVRALMRGFAVVGFIVWLAISGAPHIPVSLRVLAVGVAFGFLYLTVALRGRTRRCGACCRDLRQALVSVALYPLARDQHLSHQKAVALSAGFCGACLRRVENVAADTGTTGRVGRR